MYGAERKIVGHFTCTFITLLKVDMRVVSLEQRTLLSLRQIQRKNYEVKFCWNVLIKALGRRIYQKNVNRCKMLASVKLMISYGRV